ncbi:MAG: ERCC4 domain-containing protein [Desulfomonilaceae bacterium]
MPKTEQTPIFAVDSREKLPWEFDFQIIKKKLPVGDYAIWGLERKLIVERKSLPDLISCLSWDRDRFEAELARATALTKLIVIFEASWSDILEGRYKSKMNTKSARESIVALHTRYDVPFLAGENRMIANQLCQSYLLRTWKENVRRDPS